MDRGLDEGVGWIPPTVFKPTTVNVQVMFLRNHGVVCCGRTIEEAWLITYHTVLAVDTQLKMMPYGMDNLVLIGNGGGGERLVGFFYSIVGVLFGYLSS